MHHAHVLLLEDDPLWVETVREVVAPHVQTFHAAASLVEAEALIQTHFFTVAIIDISLLVGDPQDSQGMHFLQMLAKYKLDQVISAVVLSAYGDMARQRAAFRDFHVVDFLAKANFNPTELLGAIAAAQQDKQRADTLTIEVEAGLPLAALWNRFEWAQRESPAELASELSDLLRRLFPGATELFLQPIRAGQSGAGVVKAEPIYGAKRGAAVIVKFGKRDKIEAEHHNFHDYIERFVNYQATTQLGYVSGRVMGAIIYSLIGAELGEVTSLADYYPHASVADLQHTLDNLIQHTCSRWYENREQPRRTRNLIELYQRGLHIHTWDEIWQGMARVYPEIEAPSLTFPGVDGEFRNPKRWLEANQYAVYLPAWLATTHGDLNEHNILVTRDNRTWLIDFYRTGAGHILRDLVELECVIKFNLAGIANLTSCQHVEATLLQQTSLAQPITVSTDDPAAKVLAVISHLRALGSDFTGPGMREYNTALLLHTLYMLSLNFLYGPDGAARTRMLLSAAMIASSL